MVNKIQGKEAPKPRPRPTSPLIDCPPGTKPGDKPEAAAAPPKPEVAATGTDSLAIATTPPSEVKVAKGESLSSIARRVLGDESRWEEIFAANRDKLRDPNRVAEGMTLRMPGAPGAEAPKAPTDPEQCRFTPGELSREAILGALDEAKEFANGAPETYKVKKGDSLSRIASRLLGDAGRWQEILDANPDVLTRPESLQPGMTLKIPDGAKVVLRHRAEEVGEEGPVQSGQLWDMAREIGEKHDVDPRLVMAVVQKESGGNPRARSHAGARGLMQLMPGTASDLGVRDSYNARQNMDGGTRYLKGLLRQYGDVRLALMAYNWGPGNVNQYIRGRKNPPKETRDYVPAVLAYYRQFGGRA
jgi:nucleoid-associated protein YgaU